MMDTMNQLIALVGYVIGQKQSIEIPKEELNKLFRLAKKHMLSSIVGMALESSGQNNEMAQTAVATAFRRMILMNSEAKKLFEAFEKAGIWFAPLKGTVIKDFYPRSGMREMSDCDILYDANRAEDVKGIMEELGYTTTSFGEDHHDVYTKEPVTNIEMHRTLFQERHQMYEYYQNIKEKLVLDEGWNYRYHFLPEDFYIYMIAHEYVHFAYYPGTGIRSLVDTYVFLKKFNGKLDWKYIFAECKKIGVDKFEEKNRLISLHLFDDEQMTNEEKDFFKYFMTEGIYGSTKDGVTYKVDTLGGGVVGKIKYIMKRLFPSMRWIKQKMPFVYKHKFLLPIVPFIRIGQAFSTKRKVAMNELKTVIKK